MQVASGFPDVGAIRRKPGHSAHDGGECVEVTGGGSVLVAVRDSENPEGPVLVFTGDEWRTFIHGIKAGDIA